jgi:8-oxo-dGTP pyrophosphatase MutT (NUDIX family)
MTSPLLSFGYEIAAGGVVYSAKDPAKIAIVHRAAHGDWTLPKGRPEPDESIADTAVREAQEEIGRQVRREKFLGSYAYLKADTPKVVLLWRMSELDVPFAHPAPPEEVAEVVWLEPAAALERLSHPAERAFVTQFCL